MQPTTRLFSSNARAAIADPDLRDALATLPGGMVAKRRAAIAALPEFDALRDIGRDIRDHALAHLDHYLGLWEERAQAAGTHVHWARTASEARQIVTDICRAAGARVVTKGKSMISEEIALNDHLAAEGMEVVETDLGEYLLQLGHETPSHLVAPALHLTRPEIERRFRAGHSHLDPGRSLATPPELVAEARLVLREKFLAADVGITGANFLIAETGSAVIVTNEGNGDLTQSLPRVHVTLASIEKVLPTLEDFCAIQRLLARSATGQECTTYTTIATGPRRPDDPDGPSEHHVVLVDNGRTEILASDIREVLRCIRCGACMNHCPVYGAIGGHAYGWVYPGPIGAVLNPSMLGIAEAGQLPNASTFCGRCEDVCPMRIPLPDLMRRHRAAQYRSGERSLTARAGLAIWACAARRPRVYHLLARFAAAILGAMGSSRGRLAWLPMAAGWTRHRDLPAPQGRTFQQLWAERRAGLDR